jgi:hypothetical protein
MPRPPADVLTTFADDLERFAGRPDLPGLAAIITELRRTDEAGTGPRADEARYRRLCDAVADVRCEALRSGDDELFDWSHADAAALIRMTAAVQLVEASGLAVDRGDDASAHRRRAAHWRRYGRGPVPPLHRACSADIVRGSLRLLDDARGQPSSRHVSDVVVTRADVHQLRVRLAQWVRAECTDALGRWRADAASVARGGAAAYEARVRAAAAAMIDEIDGRVVRDVRALTDRHAEARSLEIRLPTLVPTPRRVENQLTGVLGAGFGLGAALASGRLLAEVTGGPALAGVVGGALVGIAVTLWLIAARNLLHTRAVLDRWAVDVAAAVRSHCEALVASRLLTVEVALIRTQPGRGKSFRGVTDRNTRVTNTNTEE